MNIVLFAPYAINTPHFETELDLAHTHADQGDHVTILTCGGELESCDPNLYHDAPRCAKCMGKRDCGLKLIPPSIVTESFYRLTDEDRCELDQLQTRYNSHEALKKLTIGGFDIGFAVLSSIITKTRDPGVDLVTHASLLHHLFRAAWTVHRSMCRYLDTHEVDRVYFFNGRFANMRAVLRACQAKGVECFPHERGQDPSRYILLPNTTIHDLEFVQRLIWDFWNAASDNPDREQIARQWYEARDRGDIKDGIVREQRPRRLPADWDDRKRNVTIFVSSEDECASVSEAWRNPLYDTQIDGIRAIINSLADDPGDLHLYVRAHPNLALVDNVQTRQIAKLEAPFLTVIPPADPVDTYEMMRRSESVVTFGSTTGIEAVYWGTPSILAGMAFYREFGATYNPTDHDELIRMLRSELQPKPVEPALVYAFFWPQFGVPFKYFVADGFYSGRFKGVRLRPTFRALIRMGVLRVVYPQRALRHLKRMFTKRSRLLRNRLRRRV